VVQNKVGLQQIHYEVSNLWKEFRDGVVLVFVEIPEMSEGRVYGVPDSRWQTILYFRTIDN